MNIFSTPARGPVVSLLPFFLIWVTLASSALGEVKPNPLFAENAVLQQGMEVPVWGVAGEGEKVTVSIDGSKVTAAAKNGKWMVRLPSHAAGGPFQMTIEGANTVTIKNVMFGEVWICSGQSNMAFVLGGADNVAEEIPKADYPQIRMFTVSSMQAMEPAATVAGSWAVCSPKTAAQFSAVGYFFARDLFRAKHVPVGMIHTSVSGSPGQAWMSIDALEKEPELANYLGMIKAQAAAYPEAKAKFPQAVKDYEERLKKWNEEIGQPYNEALKTWAEENRKAKSEGRPESPKPPLSSPAPVKPGAPEGSTGSPTVLYNGKIAPLIPYAIKGFIWYQGESNGGKEYRTMLPRLISDWREKWGQGDFPFLFVQIAPYKDKKPEIREAQLLTWQKVPNTAMVVTTDVGDAANIHPKRKEPVGARLALAARAIAYGEKIEYSGPIFEGLRIEGSKAVVRFTHLGGGLVAKDGPLKGFTIAGADKKFVTAEAEIQEGTVIVSSRQVGAPMAVRYGWANAPDTNLFNQEGLPASPFRSDVE